MGLIRKAASIMMLSGLSSHAGREPSGKAERARAKADRAQEKAAQAQAVRAEAEAAAVPGLCRQPCNRARHLGRPGRTGPSRPAIPARGRRPART
jgi:hypothetical protein